MNRSQRTLVAIGLAALTALAAPYVMRLWVDHDAVAGKTLVYAGQSYRPEKDLVLCLIRHPGALALSVTSNDLYSDPASGLAVRVEKRHDFRRVSAWLPKGAALSADQAAQLKSCTLGS